MASIEAKTWAESLRDSHFVYGFFLQGIVASWGAMVIGFIPGVFVDRYFHNTALEAFAPGIVATAIVLGFLVNRWLGNSSAMWVWVAGFAWLAYNAYQESELWNTTRAVSRMSYIVDNFFGPPSKCSDGECVAEFLFTAPFAATVGYSFGAGFGLLSYKWAKRRKEILATQQSLEDQSDL